MPHPSPVTSPRRTIGFGLASALLALFFGLAAVPGVAAADGLTMEASALLDGHARIGTWMAISVRMKNDGPPVAGELRIAGGAQGRTRFGTAVDMPTGSDKTYLLYAQPPAFGREIEVKLIDGDTTIASSKAPFALHDATQLVIGVVAERPGDIVGSLDLLPNQNQVAPLAVPLDPEDLPDRIEAWGSIDRLIWQDVDSSRLRPEQLEAMTGWLASGGRLVIVGGTAGAATLSSFPEELLPYRATGTTEIAPSSLAALLGAVPENATDVLALTGSLVEGRVLASSGDQTVAADRAYGSGSVTIVGFDPTVAWIADTDLADTLWRRLLPYRSSGGPVISEDSQIVSAASQLPSLALPPIGGLVALLGGYILLIGPINYLVLRRLDRREWAWVTMPVLIAAFAAGAYGFGSFLRGSDLIVNEVAIVRGAPGATEGTAQVYLGVFSPTRGKYQVSVPGGALLSSPISGDFFGGDGTAAALDVLQGEPARVRDLDVGFGSLRTLRAETAVEVPLIETDLRLEDGRLKGTVRNASDERLEKATVVLGGTVAKIDDLEPGEQATVDQVMQNFELGSQLSDKIVGPVFFGDPTQLGDDAARLFARHTIVDQLTYDPNFGFSGQLAADGPVFLAWGERELLDVEIEGQTPLHMGNILYYLPADLAVSGQTTFRTDLMRSTVVESDAAFFSKDPYSINFGRGSATLAYSPIAFEGTLEPTKLAISLNFGGEVGLPADSEPLKPIDVVPEPCDANGNAAACPEGGFDGLPEVELFDLTDGTWKRFPHMAGGSRYPIADPARYIDPSAGTVVIRFVNDRSDGVGFSADVSVEGTVR